MLKDKIIVITGGAGLLGKEFVKAVVRNNGTAVIADIDRKKAETAAQEVRTEIAGARIEVAELDITSRDSIQELLSGLKKKFGTVDALVNNAYPRNKNYGRKFEDVTYADFCENVSLHLGGYFLMCQQFAAFFREQKHGNIINMASVYGVIAPRFEVYDGTPMTMPVEYAAIKSGIVQLTKYCAKYLKGTTIRINAISPGGILDGQPEGFVKKYNALALSKGMLDRSDLQGTLVFLLSDSSKYINGQNLIVDDGFSL